MGPKGLLPSGDAWSVKKALKKDSFVIKGDFYWCAQDRSLTAVRNACCVVINGVTQGVYSNIPADAHGLKVMDYSGKMIIPGLADLHLHASQYRNMGVGMGEELLQWLSDYTFPEEKRFEDPEYAAEIYQKFADDLRRSPTTRAAIFATIHTDTTLLLMKLLEKTGLLCYVGKVNMDRNSPGNYIETTAKSLSETRRFLKEAEGRFENIQPILTPRFVPACSDELMKGLGEIQKESGLPVQSHLSENRNEIRWVKELCPDAAFYGDAYDRFGLFGRGCPTIMAHCVSSSDEEIERIARNGVFIAHCPNSNMNLRSGIAPIRRYMNRGLHVGLGTDIAAGHSLSLFDEMISAVQASKMRWRYVEDEPENTPALTMTDAFYLATRGGGEFFGNVGAFENGYEFDALILDDTGLRAAGEERYDTGLRAAGEDRQMQNDEIRLERALYRHSECRMIGKYAAGSEISLR